MIHFIRVFGSHSVHIFTCSPEIVLDYIMFFYSDEGVLKGKGKGWKGKGGKDKGKPANWDVFEEKGRNREDDISYVYDSKG